MQKKATLDCFRSALKDMPSNKSIPKCEEGNRVAQPRQFNLMPPASCPLPSAALAQRGKTALQQELLNRYP